MSDYGCWYCNDGDNNEEMLFSAEFDTFVHESCLMKYDDLEADIMKWEFNLKGDDNL